MRASHRGALVIATIVLLAFAAQAAATDSPGFIWNACGVTWSPLGDSVTTLSTEFGQVTPADVDLDGESAWVGTAGGVARIRLEDGSVTTISTGFDRPTSRNVAFSEDSAWVGTAGGVARIRIADESVTTISTGFGHPPTENVYVRGDSVWVGTAGGVARFRIADESVTSFLTGFITTGDIVFSEESAWVGTAGGVARIGLADDSVSIVAAGGTATPKALLDRLRAKEEPRFRLLVGLGAKSYQLTVDRYTTEGWRLSRVDAVTCKGGQPSFSAIWEPWDRNDPLQSWAARHGLCETCLEAEDRKLSDKGFKPVSVAGYEEGAQARFAAIWHYDPDASYVLQSGLTSNEYQDLFDRLGASGYRLIDVDGYLEGGKLRFVGLWYLEDGAYVGRHGMTEQDFNWEHVATGFEPLRVGAYPQPGGTVGYTKVWHWQDDATNFVFAHLSEAEHQALTAQKLSQGYQPLDVAAWIEEESGRLRYGSVWRAPDDLLKLTLPLGGVPNRDWVIVNYQDHDAGPGLLDHMGGQWLYNNHNGTDFTLRSFQQMDAGVPVFAAADGEVVTVIDRHPDRNTCGIPGGTCGTPGNAIWIEHPNGQRTWYEHLRRGSATVAVGDRVTRGQKIAEVGSSGNSSDAHLHFAVLDRPYGVGVGGGDLVDPFEGPSGNSRNLWMTGGALRYAPATLNVLDAGTTDHQPTRLEHTERVPTVDDFTGPFGASDEVYFWFQVNGRISADNRLTVRLIRPDGKEHWSDSPDPGTEWRYGFPPYHFNLQFLAGIEKGTWRFTVEVNHTEVVSAPFTIHL